jgi:uncharacterized protein (TIGR00255 family)
LIKSMTAYGRGEVQQGDVVLIAEIRSVNNRFRDIILRIPKNYQIFDNDLRAIISSRIRRGRVEVSIQMEDNGVADPYDLELNVPLVNSYFKIFEQLREQFGLDKEIRLESLCQMKDVILYKPEPVDIDKMRPYFQEVVTLALDSLDLMRTKEGESIEADLSKRLDMLEGYVNEVEERAPHLVEEYRKRLQDNIAQMLNDLTVDESRLAQEVAFFAEKSDITEEMVRLRSHLKQFREYLLIDEALGRRLDFLIQEMNREVNTLGSKASESHISRVVVEMKAELEKLREQIQNVE